MPPLSHEDKIKLGATAVVAITIGVAIGWWARQPCAPGGRVARCIARESYDPVSTVSSMELLPHLQQRLRESYVPGTDAPALGLMALVQRVRAAAAAAQPVGREEYVPGSGVRGVLQQYLCPQCPVPRSCPEQTQCAPCACQQHLISGARLYAQYERNTDVRTVIDTMVAIEAEGPAGARPQDYEELMVLVRVLCACSYVTMDYAHASPTPAYYAVLMAALRMSLMPSNEFDSARFVTDHGKTIEGIQERTGRRYPALFPPQVIEHLRASVP